MKIILNLEYSYNTLLHADTGVREGNVYPGFESMKSIASLLIGVTPMADTGLLLYYKNMRYLIQF